MGRMLGIELLVAAVLLAGCRSTRESVREHTHLETDSVAKEAKASRTLTEDSLVMVWEVEIDSAKLGGVLCGNDGFLGSMMTKSGETCDFLPENAMKDSYYGLRVKGRLMRKSEAEKEKKVARDNRQRTTDDGQRTVDESRKARNGWWMLGAMGLILAFFVVGGVRIFATDNRQ